MTPRRHPGASALHAASLSFAVFVGVGGLGWLGSDQLAARLDPRQAWLAATMLVASLSALVVWLAGLRLERLKRHVDRRDRDMGKANRILEMVRLSHHAMLNARSEQELGLWLASILTEKGGYRVTRVAFAPHGSDHPTAAADGGAGAASFPFRSAELAGTLVVQGEADGFSADEAATLAWLAQDLALAATALRTAAARDQSEALFRNLLENSVTGVYMIQDSRFTYVNPRMGEILGYAAQDLIGMSAIDVAVPADREMVANNIRRRITGETPRLQYQFRGLHADGHSVPVEVLGSTTMLAGRPVVIGTLIDQSERSQFIETIRLRDRAIEASANGIMISDAVQSDHPIIYVNPAFERITGYGRAEALGRRGRFLLGEDWDQPGLTELRSALRDKREARVVLRNYRKDGQVFWNELTVSPVRDSGGAVSHFVSIFNDVSHRIEQERRLLHQATHDVLTGLANRSLLNDRIAMMASMAARSGKIGAVMLIDIDHFKYINDSMGHGSGDQLLKDVAARLVGVLRATDTVARLGGDEFVVVMNELEQPEDALAVANKIKTSLRDAVVIGDRPIFTSASVGISLFPRDGVDADTLLRNADAAMYRVKENGRDNCCFYGPELNQRALARVEMEADLHRALRDGELMVHYQPKACLTTGRVTGAEALLRWNHPTRGAISPAEFIPLAEETGQIVAIGEWVLATAARQTLEWKAIGHPIQVSVNLSPRQLRLPDAVERIAAILAGCSADPSLLELELTEGSVMDRGIDGGALLKGLQQLGMTITLDDFGTGYSSLSYLTRFPLDGLKIDRSFIRNVETCGDHASIVSAIIAMARQLKLKVVAEGVETFHQADFLRDQNCDEMQGFLFSAAMPAIAVTAMLRQGLRLWDSTVAAAV